MTKDKKKKGKKKDKEKSARSDIKRMKGSIIPVAFGDFIEMLEDLGELNHKGTISTLSNDDVGVFMSIPKQGSSVDKISLFLNKSRGWTSDNEYKALEIDEWHTGDVRVSVSDSDKAMKQAFKICKEWMKAKDDHTPSPSKKKADDDDEPKKKKGKKKDKKKAKAKNGEDKEEKKAKRKKRKKKDRAEAEA